MVGLREHSIEHLGAIKNGEITDQLGNYTTELVKSQCGYVRILTCISSNVSSSQRTSR